MAEGEDKMRWILWTLVCALLAGSVDAYTLEYTVYSYQTMQPIENVNVTVRNATLEISGLTDVNGYVVLSAASNNLTLTAEKAGYANYASTANFSGNVEQAIYLEPYSHSGIIRVKFVDMTLGGRDGYCIYFTSNNRQFGCYNINDTLTLHTNLGYRFSPYLTPYDMASPGGVVRGVWLYYGTAIGFIVLFGIALVFVYVFVKVIWK